MAAGRQPVAASLAIDSSRARRRRHHLLPAAPLLSDPLRPTHLRWGHSPAAARDLRSGRRPLITARAGQPLGLALGRKSASEMDFGRATQSAIRTTAFWPISQQGPLLASSYWSPLSVRPSSNWPLSHYVMWTISAAGCSAGHLSATWASFQSTRAGRSPHLIGLRHDSPPPPRTSRPKQLFAQVSASRSRIFRQPKGRPTPAVPLPTANPRSVQSGRPLFYLLAGCHFGGHFEVPAFEVCLLSLFTANELNGCAAKGSSSCAKLESCLTERTISMSDRTSENLGRRSIAPFDRPLSINFELLRGSSCSH